MLEYDIYELKEEQARLPPNSNKHNKNTISNQDINNSAKKKSLEETDASAYSTESGQDEPNLSSSSPSTSTHSAIYPAVQEYIDQVVRPLPPLPGSSSSSSQVSEVKEKRRRPRRVYSVESTRISSLRSHQSQPVIVTAAEKPITPPPPPVEASPTPTEATTEEHKYIKVGKCMKLTAIFIYL